MHLYLTTMFFSPCNTTDGPANFLTACVTLWSSEDYLLSLLITRWHNKDSPELLTFLTSADLPRQEKCKNKPPSGSRPAQRPHHTLRCVGVCVCVCWGLLVCVCVWASCEVLRWSFYKMSFASSLCSVFFTAGTSKILEVTVAVTRKERRVCSWQQRATGKTHLRSVIVLHIKYPYHASSEWCKYLLISLSLKSPRRCSVE